MDSKSRAQFSCLKVVNVLLTILIDKMLQIYFGRISEEMKFAGQTFALEELLKMNITLGWKLEKVSLAWWVTCGHLWALSTCVFVLFVHRSMHADEKYSSYPSRLNHLFTATASIFGSKKKRIFCF